MLNQRIGELTMKCPRTNTPLKKVSVGKISVNISQECGGAFFEHTELSKFKSRDEIRGQALAKHLKQFNSPLANEKERINCPKCDDIVMMRRYYSPLKIIEIDECPGCGGIWLDTGELEKIQQNELSGVALAKLRMEMIEQTAPAKIELTKHKYSNWHTRGSHLMTVFHLATSMFDDY